MGLPLCALENRQARGAEAAMQQDDEMIFFPHP